MPKKHTPSYAKTRSSYVHPSLQTSQTSQTSIFSPSSEIDHVTQLIQQLRREQAPRLPAEQWNELAEAVSSRTVPPEIRRILQLPEVNAPKPKAGTYTRREAGAPRAPPGPAAPSSWLQKSRHAPYPVRTSKYLDAAYEATTIFGTLARLTGEEFKRLPPRRSLRHQCLRTFALYWDYLSEYEQHYIPALSITLKEALLSYIALYGHKEYMDTKSLKILMQKDEKTGVSGWDEVRFLDFTDLLGRQFTLADLSRCLKHAADPAAQQYEKCSNDDIGLSKGKYEPLVESWEDEEELSLHQPVFTTPLKTAQFINLSRLSLAQPGSWASWPELLRMSHHFSKITHLSLAYWPRPSMTPNAASASMIPNYASVTLCGSHFYSNLDDDWHESANIMRRFSTQTYSLQWLDLEGCTWLKALTWQFHSPPTPPASSAQDSESWQVNSSSLGPDWNGSWRRVSYLHVFQGSIPHDEQILQSMPASIVPVQLMRWLRDTKDNPDAQRKLNPYTTLNGTIEWLQKEKENRMVEQTIHEIRKNGQGAWCQVDHGWESGIGESRRLDVQLLQQEN